MRESLARLLLLLILVGIVVVLVPVNRDLGAQANLGQDFLPLWVAARVEFREGESAYDQEAVQAVYEAQFDTPVGAVIASEDLNLTRPLTGILPAAPLTFAPYPLARALWLTLVQLLQPVWFLLAAELSGLRKRLRLAGLAALVLYAVLWRYGLEGMIGGHPVILEAALGAGGVLLLSRSRGALAGALIALAVLLGGTLAPLGVLLALDQLKSRGWAFLTSGLAVLGVILAFLYLRASGWLLPWLAASLQSLREQGFQSPIAVLGPAVVWIPVGLILLLFMVWHWIRWLTRGEREEGGMVWVGSLTLAVSFAVLGPLHPAGPLLLVPALTLVAASFRDRWGRGGSATILGAAIVLLVLPWLPLLPEVPVNPSGAWLYWLPLGAALLGLWWVRWWVVRGPRLTLSGTAAG